MCGAILKALLRIHKMEEVYWICGFQILTTEDKTTSNIHSLNGYISHHHSKNLRTIITNKPKFPWQRKPTYNLKIIDQLLLPFES